MRVNIEGIILYMNYFNQWDWNEAFITRNISFRLNSVWFCLRTSHLNGLGNKLKINFCVPIQQRIFVRKSKNRDFFHFLLLMNFHSNEFSLCYTQIGIALLIIFWLCVSCAISFRLYQNFNAFLYWFQIKYAIKGKKYEWRDSTLKYIHERNFMNRLLGYFSWVILRGKQKLCSKSS